MCGILCIFNYFDKKHIINTTLYKLKKLQNRGRDSYGLLFHSSETKKTKNN